MSQPAPNQPQSFVFSVNPADFKTRDAYVTYAVVFLLIVGVFVVVWSCWGKKYEVVREEDPNGGTVYHVESNNGFWAILAVIIAIVCVYSLARKSLEK